MGRHNQRGRAVSRYSLPAGGVRGEETQQHRGGERELPLEAVKFLISEAMTKRVSRNNRPLKLSFIDVKKAHWCSDVMRKLYVEPPPEANEPLDIV